MPNTRQDKVLLSSIKTLTFYKDALTTSKRSSPIRESDLGLFNFETRIRHSYSIGYLDSIAQLTCHNSEACSLYQPEVIQCTNTGDDGTGNIQWKVRAPLLQECDSGIPDMSCTAMI